MILEKRKKEMILTAGTSERFAIGEETGKIDASLMLGGLICRNSGRDLRMKDFVALGEEGGGRMKRMKRLVTVRLSL